MAETLSLNQAACDYLSSRWHDAVLDLESVQQDVLRKTVRFVVFEELTEQRVPVVALGRIGVFSVPIQSTLVTLWPAKDLRVKCDAGEAELFISRVMGEPDVFRIQAMNGNLEVVGESMQLSLETHSSALEVGRVLDLGLINVSWRSRKGRRLRGS